MLRFQKPFFLLGCKLCRSKSYYDWIDARLTDSWGAGGDAGSHTFQGLFGCELRNNQSSGAFWRYAYDGRDFIEFNKEIPAWVALDPAARDTKQKWEAEEVYVQRAKAYLEEECPGMLRRYLQDGKIYLDRQGTRRFLGPAPLH